MSDRDVRCPQCGRLVGKWVSRDAIEIRRSGHPLAVLERGVLYCTDPQCRSEVPIPWDERPDGDGPTGRQVFRSPFGSDA